VRGQRRPEPALTTHAADAAAHEDEAAAPAADEAYDERPSLVPAAARAAAAPEPRPEPRLAADPRPSAQPQPAQQQSVRREEQRYATTPSPADIRARAEEVRQRALEARRRRDEERRATMPVSPVLPEAVEDAPALFEIDEASLDRRVAEARMSAHPAHPAQPARRSEDPFAARPRAEAEPEPRQQGRTGLFTINKLIHRVAGHSPAQPAPDERQQRAERRDPPDFDDGGGDIPAFLRRQAN
jgi:hypothetical protein